MDIQERKREIVNSVRERIGGIERDREEAQSVFEKERERGRDNMTQRMWRYRCCLCVRLCMNESKREGERGKSAIAREKECVNERSC